MSYDLEDERFLWKRCHWLEVVVIRSDLAGDKDVPINFEGKCHNPSREESRCEHLHRRGDYQELYCKWFAWDREEAVAKRLMGGGNDGT